jgi:hypothetical protein
MYDFMERSCDDSLTTYQSMSASIGTATLANAGKGLRYPYHPCSAGFGHQFMYWTKMDERATHTVMVKGCVQAADGS